MKRTVDVDMEFRCAPEKAIAKFFKKHPELNYWEDTFEYMLENGLDHFDARKLGNGEYNKDWAYALHLDIDEQFKYVYMCVIERE